MTEQIVILTPNLYTMGLEIQENVLKGYRLQDGYPLQLGWQYEAVMTKAAVPVIPQPTPERSVGRPRGSAGKAG
jgi:hypothetical protein